MPESLNPAFVEIQYSSPKSIHIQRIPTREYDLPDGTYPTGHFQRWSDDGARDAGDMIVDLVTLTKAVMPTTHSFIGYTIYTIAAPGDPPQPRYSATLGIAGTVAAPGWWEAVQGTFNFRDTDFHAMKLTLLDMDSTNLFGKLVDIGSIAALDAIADEIMDEDNAWSSQRGFRPTIAISFTRTLNEKLRRAYGHTG